MDYGPDDFIPTRHSLLSRLKDWDDQESWRDFIDTYWKLIYGVTIKAGLSGVEAQQVVQETVIAVAKKIPEFKTDPAFDLFKAQLLHLTRCRIADQFRKRQRQGRAQQHRSDKTSTSTIGRIQDPAGFELGHIWDDEWEKNLMDVAIKKVKRRSNPRHYQMFYLHVIERQSVLRVAKSLGVSAAQVYLVKHRIGRRIKREINQLQTEFM